LSEPWPCSCPTRSARSLAGHGGRLGDSANRQRLDLRRGVLPGPSHHGDLGRDKIKKQCGQWPRVELVMHRLRCLAGVRALSPGLWTVLLFVGGVSDANADPEYQREFYQSLKGPDAAKELKRVGTNADRLVRFEPEGARINLPGNAANDQPPVGLATDFTVRGDFEITVAYEILHEPAPEQTSGFGTRLTLITGVEAPTQSQVKFARAVRSKGGSQVLAFSARWDATTGMHEKRMKDYPTAARSGRLRLVRSGPLLSFHAADSADGPFTLLREYGFGTADLQGVRILGSTDRPEAALDVRLTDLRIRAGSFPNAPMAAAPDVAAPVTEVRQRAWLRIAAAVFVLIVGMALAGWLYGRRRKPAPEGQNDAR
jgi:Protein of unknown function (DUF1583)